MTKEQIEILRAGADLLMNSVSSAILSQKEGRQEGRDYIKKIMDSIDELDKIKTKD